MDTSLLILKSSTMSNFIVSHNISVKVKVEICNRRFDNFYLDWHHRQLSLIPLEERPVDIYTTHKTRS